MSCTFPDDGSVVVSGLPISPFVPLQHQKINVATVDLLANYTLRLARERGWLQTESERQRVLAYYEESTGQPILKADCSNCDANSNTEKSKPRSSSDPADDMTVFYAGVEATLTDPRPSFQYAPVPSALMVSSHYFVSHVGRSSYGLYAELYAYTPGEGDAASRTPKNALTTAATEMFDTTAPNCRRIGHFSVTAVQVSRSQRSPRPLAADKRALLLQSYEQSRAYLAEFAPHAVVSRLRARDLLDASGLLSTPAAEADMNHLVISQGPHIAASEGNNGVFRILYRIRETDLDFNCHVNQLAMLTLVLNAFRSALRSPAAATKGVVPNTHGNIAETATGSVFGCLLDVGVPPMVGDLLLRRARIDYLHEIPMAHEAVEVFLFPLNAHVAAKMAASKAGARLGQLVDVAFFCCGVPCVGSSENPTPSDRYLATAGVLACAV